MAARQTLRLSSSSLKTLMSSSSSSTSNFASKSVKLTSVSTKPNCASRFSLHRLGSSSRLPVELASLQCLIPLHSLAPSQQLTSLHNSKWNCLSEGYATPP